MLLDLGAELHRSRTAGGRSVEDVAAAAGISTSYLRKLERGHVNDPSPRVLRRVAAALNLRYLALMALAGYLPTVDSPDAPRDVPANDLTEEEQRAVRAFAEFLISQRE